MGGVRNGWEEWRGAGRGAGWPENVYSAPLFRSRSQSEPVLFGRSRCEGPAPGSDSTLDKTEEILNDILSVRSNID